MEPLRAPASAVALMLSARLRRRRHRVAGSHDLRIDRLSRDDADRALRTSAKEEGADVDDAALAVGFFGSRYERATPAEREYMRAMADLGLERGDAAVPTSAVAQALGRKPQSLSPARDVLLKKGLVFSAERGQIAFTVPHFGRYLRGHATD